MKEIMKKLLVLITLVLSACSNSNQKGPGPADEVILSDKVYDISELVTFSNNLTVDGNVSNAGSIDFVSSAQETSLVKNIKIRNKSSETKALDIKISDPNITISINRCGTSLAPNIECTVRLTQKMRTTLNGETGSFLQIMSVPEIIGVPTLSKISNSTYVPVTSDGSVNDLLVTMPSFDDYEIGTRVTKTATLKNISPSKTITNLTFTLPAGFRLLLSRCGTSLTPGNSCTLRVHYDGPAAPNPAAQLLVSDGTTVKPVPVAAPTAPQYTYSSSFSTYSPAIPSNPAACSGSVTSTRTMTCTRSPDSVVVDNSFCPQDNLATVITASPAGNKTINVTRGTRTTSCAAGSTVETFVSGACTHPLVQEYLPYDITGYCNPITYSPTYSAYSPVIPSSQVACDGTVVSTRSMTCKRDSTGDVVSNSYCEPDTAWSVSSASPAGTKRVDTLAGYGMFSCGVGSTSMNFIEGFCDNSTDYVYVQSGNSGSCVLKYSAVIANLSTPAEYSYYGSAAPLTATNLGITASAGSGSPSLGTGSASSGAGATSTNAAPASTGTPITAVSDISQSQTITVNLTSNGSLVYCASPSLTFASCSNSSFSFASSYLKDVTGTLSVSLNNVNSATNAVSVTVPYATYSAQQISNSRSAGYDQPGRGTEFNGEFYFGMYDANTRYRLFKLTAAGALYQVSNINANSSDLPQPNSTDGAYNLVVFNNELYFAGINSAGLSKLFKINTSGVITQVSNIFTSPSTSGNDEPKYLTLFNNQLYFVAGYNGQFGSDYNTKIYRLNSLGSISQVSNVRDFNNDIPRELTVFNGELYFTAEPASLVKKLYKVTAAGVVTRVSNTSGVAGNSDEISALTVFNGNLHFGAMNSAGRFKAHRITPGQVITQVADTNSLGNDLSSPQFVEFNNDLYFASQDSNYKMKLYKLTTSGAVIQVTNINGSANNDQPYNLVVYKNELYFSAAQGSSNYTLKLNTSGVVSRVLDRVGSYGSTFNGSLYFNASNSSSSRLFKITKTP